MEPVGIATQGVEVIPVENYVHPKVIGRHPGRTHLLVAGMLWLNLHTHLDRSRRLLGHHGSFRSDTNTTFSVCPSPARRHRPSGREGYPSSPAFVRQAQDV